MVEFLNGIIDGLEGAKNWYPQHTDNLEWILSVVREVIARIQSDQEQGIDDDVEY